MDGRVSFLVRVSSCDLTSVFVHHVAFISFNSKLTASLTRSIMCPGPSTELSNLVLLPASCFRSFGLFPFSLSLSQAFPCWETAKLWWSVFLSIAELRCKNFPRPDLHWPWWRSSHKDYSFTPVSSSFAWGMKLSSACVLQAVLMPRIHLQTISNFIHPPLTHLLNAVKASQERWVWPND